MEEERGPQALPVGEWAIKALGGKLGTKTLHLQGPGEIVEGRFIKSRGGLVGVEDTPRWQGILEHTLLVYRVADYLVNELEKRGIQVDSQAVREAALLHDLGRRSYDEGTWAEEIPNYQKSLAGQRGHGWLSAKFIRRVGKKEGIPQDHYEKVARIVEVHDQTTLKPFNSLEEKIVYYADRRGEVMTDPKTGEPRLVNLDERLAGTKKRWLETGRMTQEQWDRYEAIAREVEREILGLLDGQVKPEDFPANPTQAEKDLIQAIEVYY
jgi:putative nucleotidyltransferase with HDIG domain